MRSQNEKLQRTSDDILIILTDDEELFRKKFIIEKLDCELWKCTVCDKTTKDTIYSHPALRVSTCFDCLKFYQNAIFLSHKDGTDKNCRWCAKPSKKYNCSKCTVVFCKVCIEHNFGADYIRDRVINSEWLCFICSSYPLWRLRVACSQAMKTTSSSNSEEIISLSQESQDDKIPFSQLALASSEIENEQFSSGLESQIISPKKHPKPIMESDDDIDSETQLKLSTNNNKEQEITSEERNLLRIYLQETEKEFNFFVDLFRKRIDQFSKKIWCENVKSCEQADKLVNKIDNFCDLAVNNINYIQQENRNRYQNWSKCVDKNKSINLQNNNKSCDKTQSKKKKPEVQEPKLDNDVLHIPSTFKSKPSTSKSKSSTPKTKINAKRKLSLSLKKSPIEIIDISSNEKEDILEHLDKMKHTLPDDNISPRKGQINRKEHSPSPVIQTVPKDEIISIFVPDDDSEDTRKTSKDKSPDKDCKSSSKPQTKKHFPTVTDDENTVFLESVKKPILENTTNSSSSSTKTVDNENQDILNSPSSTSIKTEPGIDNEDKSSQFSNVTMIRDQLEEIKEDTFDRQSLKGNQELRTRIREDFYEDSCSNDVTVRIEDYLCEKTGQMCQSYRTGHDSVDNSPANSVKEESNFASSDYGDSDKTEEYAWDVDINKTNDQEDTEESKDDSKEGISPIREEENSNSVKESSKLSTSGSSRFSIDEETENEEKLNYQESESDSDYERQAAFKALESDATETQSTDSDSESDSDSEDDSLPNDTYESGYVKQLSIAGELAKLRRNNLEVDYISEKSTEEIDDSEDSLQENDEKCNNNYDFDEKLKMETSVVLNHDIKNPVVVLEKIDFNKCYGLTQDGNSYNISRRNSEDSDQEIRRLTNLNSLKKRTIYSSSDNDNSDSSESRKSLSKKKVKKCSRDSEKSSSDIDSDESFKSPKSEASSEEFQFNLSQKDEDFIPDIGEDLLNDTGSEDDDDVIEVKETHKKKKEEKDRMSNLVIDEDESENSEIDEKAKWRKDKLLTNCLTLSNSDTDETNDSTANEILSREEKRYLKNIDKRKPTRRKSTESSNSSTDKENEPIILSDDDDGTDSNDTDDSDVQFVGLKRKRESDDEAMGTSNKKGRRNIREVLKDNELREETKKADKEESERKQRISLKQKTIDSLLSETQLSQEEVGLVLDVDEEKKEPIVTVHHTLVPRLKEHQKKGIKFMWDVCFESVPELQRSKGAGCILAHCMGLGKTMQIVVLVHTLLTHKVTNVKHVLIVCPLSTVFNWTNEFQQTLKVCPTTISLFDIRPDRQKKFNQKMFEVKRWRETGGVLILGYESFQSLVNEEKLSKNPEIYKTTMLESLIDPGPCLVVCDEGHLLKNGKTSRFSSLTRVKTMRRIILTGTPLQNNLMEYYYMISYVKPHLLGSKEEYKNRFVNPIVNGQYEDSNKEDIHLMKKRSHILHKKLETTVQRFEELELIPYLPEKHDYVLFLQLTPLQIKLYEQYLQLIDNTKALFKNYHALQNIWTHPALLKRKFDKKKEPAPKVKPKLYDEDFVQAFDPDSEDTGVETDWFKDYLPEDIFVNISYGMKMEILFSIITASCALKDKVLVFSSSIEELNLIEDFLKRRPGELWIKGYDYYRMDGTVLPEKRMRYCNAFNDEKNLRSRLFLVSHKVGGLGLNLTAANRVVLMDVSWNPAYDLQSVFRVYRFGQTKICYIYRLVSMGTMEEVVYSRAVTKLAVSCRVVDEHQIKRHFNSDDLQRMYRLNKDFGEPPTPTYPSDRLLANLWEKHKPLLYKFCDHQSLLENLTNEELNEEEINLAWEEFRNEVEAGKQAKEMAMHRAMYVPIVPQVQPQDLPRFPIYPPQIPQMRSMNFPQYRNIAQDSNIRYKRPNPLPTEEQIRRVYRNKIGYTYPSLPTADSIRPVASTSGTPTTFPAVSTSVNSKFTGPNALDLSISTNNSVSAINLQNVNQQPTKEIIVNPTVRNANLPINANAETVTAQNYTTYEHSYMKEKHRNTMRNNNNQISNVPIASVKSLTSQKENMLSNTINHLIRNGVIISSEQKRSQ